MESSHLTTRRLEFQAQVPNQLKEVANFVVPADIGDVGVTWYWALGFVEIKTKARG